MSFEHVEIRALTVRESMSGSHYKRSRRDPTSVCRYSMQCNGTCLHVKPLFVVLKKGRLCGGHSDESAKPFDLQVWHDKDLSGTETGSIERRTCMQSVNRIIKSFEVLKWDKKLSRGSNITQKMYILCYIMYEFLWNVWINPTTELSLYIKKTAKKLFIGW